MVEEFIEAAAKLRVAVVGETITDEFIPVKYQGQSMKSFCPVFELTKGEKQIQQGGALAIANHLGDFVKEVDFFSNEPEDIVKTRYIDANSGQKHMEFNKFCPEFFPKFNINTSDYDVVIVADFGHGFCDGITINDGFHLMCQTNSNNFGFNRLSKWKGHKKKSICVDLREASLQVNKKIALVEDEDAQEIFNYELDSDLLYITLGAKGALVTDGKDIARHPVIKSNVVDTIGAGDTFFAFASIMAHLDVPLLDKLVVPSLAASLSTTWLCNDQSVTKEKLLNHANRVV
ncbi:MAG: PfkB family carbohydrate kinase [Saprospiraceae bacterium]